jgi:hypothetical protein
MLFSEIADEGIHAVTQLYLTDSEDVRRALS